MQGVILAAGLGTRLRPVTADRSKAMAPVLGRPLVEWAMAPLAKCGMRDFVLVVGAGDDEIRDHFGASGADGRTVRFVIQESRLGMAHALSLAAPAIEGPFVLSACDSIVDRVHVEELLAAAGGADGVLSLLDVQPELVSRSAVVEMNGRSIGRIVEKPEPEQAPSRTVSLPHYVFSPEILPFAAEVKPSPRGEFELQDAIQAMIDGGGTVVGVRAANRRQVSTPRDLLELTLEKLNRRPGTRVVDQASIGSGTTISEPIHLDPGAVVGRNCSIGPGVYLESGSRIGDGATVTRSIVLRNGRVGRGETVEDRVVT